MVADLIGGASMIYRMAAFAGVLLILSFAPRAWADDFSTQLQNAETAYGKHDLRGAQKALDTAEGLLRQQRLVQWKTVLPEALDGWKAEDVQGAAAAMAMLGGGVSVSRRYRHDRADVTIEIVADSPIVTSVAGVIKMLTVIGGETRVVDGHTAVYRKDDHSLMAIIADKALITVKGQNATEDDLKAYFKAIKLAAVEALLK
jgi:hypothetical protein